MGQTSGANKLGKEVANEWQTSGRQTSRASKQGKHVGQTSGQQVASKWQTSGKQVANEWQANKWGKKVANK